MSYLQFKKRAFMALLANMVKKFIRTVTGTPSVTLKNCTDESSLISLTINGAADGVGDIGINKFNTEEWYNLLKTSETSESSTVSKGFDDVYGEYIEFDGTNNHASVKLYPEVKTGTQYTLSAYVKYISGNSYAGLQIRYTDGTNSQFLVGSDFSDWTKRAMVTTAEKTIEYIRVYTYDPSAKAQYAQIRLYEGSYTTDTIPEYEPYGYKIPFKAESVNLFNYDYFSNYNNYGRTENGYAGKRWSKQDFPPGTYTVFFDLDTSHPNYNNSSVFIEVMQWDDENKSSATRLVIIMSDAELKKATFTASNEWFLGFSVSGSPNTDQFNKLWGLDSYSDTGSLRNNIMIVEGSYTYDALPEYEQYQESVESVIYLDMPLYGASEYNDKVIIDYNNKTAQRVDSYSLDEPITTDISDKMSWDILPKTFKGTTILTAQTEVPPSNITAKYYSTEQEG